MSITGALGVVMKPQQKDLLPRKDIENYQRERKIMLAFSLIWFRAEKMV